MPSYLNFVHKNFKIKQGADFQVYLRFKDSDDELIDFTGHTVRLRAKWRDDVITRTDAQLFADENGTAFSKALGKILFWITNENSRLVPIDQQMPYFIEMIQANSAERALIGGYLIGEQGDDNIDD